MIILLVFGVWIIIIDILVLRFLLQILRTGIIYGKRGYKIYRKQEPLGYWLGILMMLVMITITFYFGCLFILQGLRLIFSGL